MCVDLRANVKRISLNAQVGFFLCLKWLPNTCNWNINVKIWHLDAEDNAQSQTAPLGAVRRQQLAEDAAHASEH